ncbi:hypothetical protein [Companilactobacillus halodurans]|uniref:Uncharacterized protein n=1 Tax=Companilactobacillus halodurans TaxID=2584183 RepID=A0A5P0ZRW7_9LACO|nr:hypothetical protein [Companilactobacillus halodurans]MQS76942.1 hypothetical protein [Companilactobacillus halodurans]MQS98523.1 hypothetical protein [Companilactobacillus halodurans]
MKNKETESEDLIGLVFTYIFVFVAVFLGLFALYFHFTTSMSVTWLLKLLGVDLVLMVLAFLKPVFDVTLDYFKDMLKNY